MNITFDFALNASDIIAVLALLATIVISIVAHCQQNKHITEQRILEHQPELSFYHQVQSCKHFTTLGIKNVGQHNVYNLIVDADLNQNETACIHDNSILAVNATNVYTIQLLERPVVVTYSDIFGNQYQQTLTITKNVLRCSAPQKQISSKVSWFKCLIRPNKYIQERTLHRFIPVCTVVLFSFLSILCLICTFIEGYNLITSLQPPYNIALILARVLYIIFLLLSAGITNALRVAYEKYYEKLSEGIKVAIPTLLLAILALILR